MHTLPGDAGTARWRRDLGLLARIARMVAEYVVGGGRVRREYRRKEARGEVYRVDAAGPTRHREEPLRRR